MKNLGLSVSANQLIYTESKKKKNPLFEFFIFDYMSQ